MDESYSRILSRLSRSKFRSRFKLNAADLVYVQRHGLSKIQEHAQAFIAKRLTPASPLRDGKQTPFQGHPVFKAQHATAACCRECLNRWHHIPKGVVLDQLQQDFVVRLIMAWIEKSMK